MQVDELTRALHAEEQSPHPLPDVELLRRRGRRSRWTRRAAVAGAALAVAAVAATGFSVVGSVTGSGTHATDVGVASETGADTLSSYERRVLREVPYAYAVGGVVVVPGPLDPND